MTDNNEKKEQEDNSKQNKDVYVQKSVSEKEKELQGLTPEQKEAMLDQANFIQKFKQKHGHANVPQKYPTNPQLGTWYV